MFGRHSGISPRRFYERRQLESGIFVNNSRAFPPQLQCHRGQVFGRSSSNDFADGDAACKKYVVERKVKQRLGFSRSSLYHMEYSSGNTLFIICSTIKAVLVDISDGFKMAVLPAPMAPTKGANNSWKG